jgi:hypothetical protein
LRHTSWPSDEALCLRSILTLNLSSIVATDDSKKMAALWQQVEAISIQLIFVECSPKLEDIGCQWALATILDGSNPQLGILSLDMGRYATPTKNGLKLNIDITAPVHIFVSVSENARGSVSSKYNFINICQNLDKSAASGEFLLNNKHRKWYSCLSEDL